jgi:hypothetical protein
LQRRSLPDCSAGLPRSRVPGFHGVGRAEGSASMASLPSSLATLPRCERAAPPDGNRTGPAPPLPRGGGRFRTNTAIEPYSNPNSHTSSVLYGGAKSKVHPPPPHRTPHSTPTGASSASDTTPPPLESLDVATPPPSPLAYDAAAALESICNDEMAHIRVVEALCLAHAPSQPLLLDLVRPPLDPSSAPLAPVLSPPLCLAHASALPASLGAWLQRPPRHGPGF